MYLKVKKRRVSPECDDGVIMAKVQNFHEQRKRPNNESEAALYGRLVSATLERFTPQQRALARIKIDEILFNIEFGSAGGL